MQISDHILGDRTGKIIELDEPGDLDTMYEMVHQHLRADINAMRDALFVLVVFRQTPKAPSEKCLDAIPGWFPVQDRTQVHGANAWHTHGAVAVHCPYQEGGVVPTGVTTKSNLDAAYAELKIRPTEQIGNRDVQVVLRQTAEHFSSDALQPSGHSLIIPAREVHAKLTTEEDFEGTGGIVQRRAWL